ncbi:MAG: hypothetical protein RLZZ326_2230 [Planctomycetota bacterium]
MAVSGSRKKVWRNGEGLAEDAARGNWGMRRLAPLAPRPLRSIRSIRPRRSRQPISSLPSRGRSMGGHCHIGCARQAARGARIRSGAQAPTDGLIT